LFGLVKGYGSTRAVSRLIIENNREVVVLALLAGEGWEA
jgi:hypothetical protein